MMTQRTTVRSLNFQDHSPLQMCSAEEHSCSKKKELCLAVTQIEVLTGCVRFLHNDSPEVKESWPRS